MSYMNVTVAGLLCVAASGPAMAQSVSLAPDTVDADAPTLEWMAQHAWPFRVIDHAVDPRDFIAWDSLTAGARVIGLGEQTHGTSEFSRMKLRLIQHGVRAKNVMVIGLENAPAPVAAINRYVHGEDGDVDMLMGGLSRLWRTEELRTVISWLRGYNTERRMIRGTQVDIVGIDVMNGSAARDSGMAESIVGELAKRPEGGRAMFWAHNVHVSYLPNRIGVQLRRMLGAGYVALGFGTAEGTYRAHAPTDPQSAQTDGHVLASPTPGSVELNLARLAPRVGGLAQLYDLHAIVAGPRGAWLTMPRSFRHIGTNAAPVIQVENVGAMFDLLIFIPTTTSSHSIAGIQ